MVILFQSSKSNVSEHIKSIYAQQELEYNSTVRKIRTVQKEGGRTISRPITYYSLDTIISLGFRINTKRGIQFRQWANAMLQCMIRNGDTITPRLDNISRELYLHKQQIQSINQRIDEMVQTALPPKYGLFFNGQVFDAYVFVVDLIKSATNSIRLADNYVDESVLLMLSKRSESVDATIFTERTTPQLQLDLRKHNAQYPPVHIKQIEKIHDRFLLIDDERLYHFGASFKDLGKKLFVATLIEEPALVVAMGKMLS
ncbi:MAG: virulence RhuM family protein [Bacteroidales bacterium]|nr:virulence RhuM family protein [Bacteroidales bacterium]